MTPRCHRRTPHPRHHTIGRAVRLDLDHGPLAGLVAEVGPLGHDAVDPPAGEAQSPPRLLARGGGGRGPRLGPACCVGRSPGCPGCRRGRASGGGGLAELVVAAGAPPRRVGEVGPAAVSPPRLLSSATGSAPPWASAAFVEALLVDHPSPRRPHGGAGRLPHSVSLRLVGSELVRDRRVNQPRWAPAYSRTWSGREKT